MSNKSTARYQGSFKNNNKCSCELKDQKVISFRIEEVPMSAVPTRVGWNLFRTVTAVATLGVSTQFNGGIKDLTHDAVRLECQCKIHRHQTFFTIEILNKSSKPVIEAGSYDNCADTHQTYYCSRNQDTLAALLTDFLKNKYFPSYCYVNYNCSHFAGEILEYCYKNSK